MSVITVSHFVLLNYPEREFGGVRKGGQKVE